jgi:cyclopropane fatty-acyl-phospholipid synthase-like methyltransferase
VEVADFTVIKQRQQQVWATGEYATVGNTLVLVSEPLCEAVDVRSGQQVLDVATGSGNTAQAAARRWAEVTGINYVPVLLRRGEARAAGIGGAVEGYEFCSFLVDGIIAVSVEFPILSKRIIKRK